MNSWSWFLVQNILIRRLPKNVSWNCKSKFVPTMSCASMLSSLRLELISAAQISEVVYSYNTFWYCINDDRFWSAWKGNLHPWMVLQKIRIIISLLFTLYWVYISEEEFFPVIIVSPWFILCFMMKKMKQHGKNAPWQILFVFGKTQLCEEYRFAISFPIKSSISAERIDFMHPGFQASRKNGQSEKFLLERFWRDSVH